MFNHYLTTALRNFGRHWVTTSVNVAGLTLGLMCFIGALSVVQYYQLDDSRYPGSARTYFITQQYLLNQSATAPMIFPNAPWIAAEYLKADMPQLEIVARERNYGRTPITLNGQPSDVWTSFVDADFLKLFPIPFVFGNPSDALSRPRSAVITEAMANRVFGTTNVVGHTILLYGREPVTIDGVVAPPSDPSHLFGSDDSSEMWLSMDTMLAVMKHDLGAESADKQLRGWNSGPSVVTYVRLPADQTLDLSTLDKHLAKLAEEHATEGIPRKLGVRPISEFRQTALDNMAERQTTGLSWSSLLILVASVILLVSCLNYANLATAVAASHQKEIGVRRALGASTKQLVAQQLCEAIILTSAALLFALAAIALVTPMVRTFYGVDLLYAWTRSSVVWQGTLGIFLVVCIAASILPIIATLRTRVATTLSHSRGGARSSQSARWLVSAQFMLAAILLIFLMVVRSQESDLVRYAHDSLQDPIVVIENVLADDGVEFNALRAELMRQPHVVSVSASSFSPWGRTYGLITLSNSRDASAADITVISEYIRHGYFSSLWIGVLAGQGFDQMDETPPTNDSQEYPIVIDKTTARQMGWNDPQEAIGKPIYPGSALRRSNPSLSLRVIGVVEDKLMQFTTGGATSTVYLRNPKSARTPLVRLAKDHTAEGLAEIQSVWKLLAPNFVLRSSFVDDYIEKYAKEKSPYINALSWLTLLAFAISLSGLVGMSIHMANRRTHEIGVRKTLGAQTGQIVALLLRDFSRPVILGNIVAWPLSYLIARTYLSVYVHRISLTPALFIGSLMIALSVACATVGWHALRAAQVNPAVVLRNE